MKKKATFAGGCFWCVVPPMEDLDGVTEVVVGFSGGKEKNPTYKEVSAGKTGHIESIQVAYDPSKTSYEELLDTFWRQIDPTDPDGQFADRGDQYRTAIFYHDEDQKKLAEKSRKEMDKSGIFPSPIVTEIRKYELFYPAEESHQDYYKKHPLIYKTYRKYSGRDRFLKKSWKR